MRPKPTITSASQTTNSSTMARGPTSAMSRSLAS